MADERIERKKVAPSDLSPNKAPLSTYLQYPTSTDAQEGWVVLADNGDGRTERTANLSVLKQIKNFLNSSPAPAPQESMEPTRIDYPFYDADSESSSPMTASEEEIDDVSASPLDVDAENHTESDAVKTEEIEPEKVEPVAIEAIPFESKKSFPIEMEENAQDPEETSATETVNVYAEERASDEPQEMPLKPETTSTCVIDANEFVDFESIPATPPVVEIVAKNCNTEKTNRRQSGEKSLRDALLPEPRHEERRPAFDSSVSKKMPIFKKFVDLMGARNLINREPSEEPLPAPSLLEENGVSVELVLPPTPLETDSPDLFVDALILGSSDVQTS
ncbi:MAG: hypothetical protein ACI4NV_05870 [Thermoguttaceae bacterium]